jgi:hypothetical protein
MGRALAHVNQPFGPRKYVQKKRKFDYYTYSATIYDDIGIGYARAAAADEVHETHGLHHAVMPI